MITFTPRKAFEKYAGWEVDWLLAYDWFARKLLAKMRGRDWIPREFLNNTSSIRNSEFVPLSSVNDAKECLRDLFRDAGQDCERGRFLRCCGIRKWGDLSKAIRIPGTQPKNFPNKAWFEMRGRTFRKSPNPCHPKATWTMSVRVQFVETGWQILVEYGYPHDASHWWLRFAQTSTLDELTARFDAEMEKLLNPDPDPMRRIYREQTWGRAYSGLQSVMYFEVYEGKNALADQLSGIEGSSLSDGRFRITPRRMRTLMSWAKSSALPGERNP